MFFVDIHVICEFVICFAAFFVEQNRDIFWKWPKF